MRAELDHTEPCGCGSGKRYGKCCKKDRVSYHRDGRGTIHKTILLDERGRAAVEDANLRFHEVFGRKPQGKDRILADGYAYSPEDLNKDTLKAFAEAGVPREIAYAFSETGLIISAESAALASPIDLKEWDDAIDRYLSAMEEGEDLLAPADGPVAENLEEFEELIKIIAIHFGSYASRSPAATRRNLSKFFQYLLVGKVHQCMMALCRGWKTHKKNETFSLLRSVYECSLLIRRLSEQEEFSNTLLAQAMVGIKPFSYRIKKNGDTDYSKIINEETGEAFEGKNSYLECAKVASEDESAFYEIVYPYLSGNVHFDARDFIYQYQKSGEFLIWEEIDEPAQAIFIMAICSYFVISLKGSSGVTQLIRRDMNYLLSKISKCFYALYISLDEEDRHVDQHTSLVFFTADRLFRGESLCDAE